MAETYVSFDVSLADCPTGLAIASLGYARRILCTQL